MKKMIDLRLLLDKMLMIKEVHLYSTHQKTKEEKGFLHNVPNWLLNQIK